MCIRDSSDEVAYWLNWHHLTKKLGITFDPKTVTVSPHGEVDVTLTVEQHDLLRTNDNFVQIIEECYPGSDHKRLVDANTEEEKDDRIWRQARRRHLNNLHLHRYGEDLPGIDIQGEHWQMYGPEWNEEWGPEITSGMF